MVAGVDGYVAADDAVVDFCVVSDDDAVHDSGVGYDGVFAYAGEVVDAGVDDSCAVFDLAVSANENGTFEADFFSA